MRRLRWTVALGAAALLLAGCGEITNHLSPATDSADRLTVALQAPPNFSQVGFYAAVEQGIYAATDLQVRFVVSTDPVAEIVAKRAQLALTSEPTVLLTRNVHTAVAAVAAVLQGPEQVAIRCTAAHPRNVTRTGAARTPAPRAHAPVHPAGCAATVNPHPIARWAAAPTYNALNLVVTEDEIIHHPGLLRRFVQATARGYGATEADPATATHDLVRYDPSLRYPAELAGVRASLSNYFPAGSASRPWGFQRVSDWNAFGSWMLTNHVISNPNAVLAAVTNELLAGQGV